MAGRDRVAAREEAVGEPAKGEHLKGPAMDRERTRLSDPFSASLEHRDLHFCQSQLACEPQPGWTTADYHDLEFISHDQHSLGEELRFARCAKKLPAFERAYPLDCTRHEAHPCRR